MQNLTMSALFFSFAFAIAAQAQTTENSYLMSLEDMGGNCTIHVYKNKDAITHSKPFECSNSQQASDKVREISKALQDKLISLPSVAGRNNFDSEAVLKLDPTICQKLPSDLAKKNEARSDEVSGLIRKVSSNKRSIADIQKNWRDLLERQSEAFYDQKCLGTLLVGKPDTANIKADQGYQIGLTSIGDECYFQVRWNNKDFSKSKSFDCKRSKDRETKNRIAKTYSEALGNQIALPDFAKNDNFNPEALQAIDLKKCENIPKQLESQKSKDDSAIAKLETENKELNNKIGKIEIAWRDKLNADKKSYYDQSCLEKLPQNLNPYAPPVVDAKRGEDRVSHGSR
jgi:hypothetical protein